MQTQIPDTAAAPTPPSVPKAPSVPKMPTPVVAPTTPAAPGANAAAAAGANWSFAPAQSTTRPSGAEARPAADEAVGTVTSATAAGDAAAATVAAGGVKGRIAKLASKVPFLANRSTRELVIAGCAILAGLVPIIAGLAIWATRTSPDIKALDPDVNDVPAAYRPGGNQPNAKDGSGSMTGPDGISNFGDFESDYNPSDYYSEPWTSPSYKPYGTSGSSSDIDTSGYYGQFSGGDSSYYYSDPGTPATAPAPVAPPPSVGPGAPAPAPAPPAPPGAPAPAPSIVPPATAAALAPQGGTVSWRWGALNGSAGTPASRVTVTATGDCRIVTIVAMRHSTTICRDGASVRVTKVSRFVTGSHTATLECDRVACSGRISALDMPTAMSFAGGTKVTPTAGGGNLIELSLAGWLERIWIDGQGVVERIEHAIEAPFTAQLLFAPTQGVIQSTAVYSR